MRIHDLLFELLMGPKLSMKHGHPISFNCTFTLHKKSKSNSLLKVNKYNILEIKQRRNKLWRSLFLRRGAAQRSLGWAGAPATCQQLQDTLPSPRAGFWSRATHSPLRAVGKFPSAQSSWGLVSVSFQSSAKELNQRICPTTLSVRKIYCQNNGM